MREIDWKTISREEAEAELGNAVYKAALIFERLEGARRVLGNGHHAAQKVAKFAVDDLNTRWITETQ